MLARRLFSASNHCDIPDFGHGGKHNVLSAICFSVSTSGTSFHFVSSNDTVFIPASLRRFQNRFIEISWGRRVLVLLQRGRFALPRAAHRARLAVRDGPERTGPCAGRYGYSARNASMGTSDRNEPRSGSRCTSGSPSRNTTSIPHRPGTQDVDRADNRNMTDFRKDGADPGISEAFSKALDDLRTLGQRINNTSASTEDVWFRNLLLGIIDCALKDHQNAKIGIQKFVPLAAWATRNLLELRIVTAYVLKSASKANQFKGELMIDVKEFYENVSKSAVAGHNKLVAMMREVAGQEQGPMRDVFMKLADKEAAKEPQTDIADAEAEACRKLLMSEFGIRDSQPPKMHGALAREVQQHEDFGPLNKIFSKLTQNRIFDCFKYRAG
jgi:hypothetical protein